VMFCSAKCSRETCEKFHDRDEFIRDSLKGSDIRKKMMRIMNESLSFVKDFDELQSLYEDFENKSVFDFDFSNPFDQTFNKKILICLAALLPKSDCGIVEYVKSNLNIPSGPKKEFYVSFISRIILNYMRNGLKVPCLKSDSPEGGMMIPAVSMMNHSCDPNTYSTFIDNTCHVFVIKPIKAGEQIFLKYR
jgi:hypothetical protein